KIVRVPKQLLLIHSCKAKRPAPDQYGDLFQPCTCSHYKVFKAGIFPIFVPLSRNSHSQFGFQILKAVKAKVDVLSFYGGLRFTSIDTESVDISTCLMGFVDIDFSLIKASIVVQHGNHELQRIVGLQVKALVTFHSKTGTVRLVEGIP